MSINCNRGTPLSALSEPRPAPVVAATTPTAKSPVFCTVSTKNLSMHNNGHVENLDELRCGVSNLLHSLHCAHPSLWQNKDDQHSVDERNLKHLTLSIGEDCWSQERPQRPPPQPCPVFIYRSGLAVNLGGAIGRDESHPSTSSSVPNDACCASAACQDDGLWHGHFRHLLRQLRLAKHGALRDGVLKSNLGHGNTPVEDLQDIRHVFHHMQHRSVKIEHRHRHERLDNLLHGVPLDPLLRPWLSEWSPPRNFIIGAQLEELGDCVLLSRGASFTVMAPAGCLGGAAWCVASASAIATVSSSCRKN